MNHEYPDTKQTRDNKEVKIPRRINREIKDLVHPIVLRRSMLWRAALGVVVLALLGAAAWAVFFQPPTGEELLEDVVATAGGMESWNAINEGSFTRLHRVYDESEALISQEEETFYFHKGEGGFKLTVASTSDAGYIIIGRDEEGYWATKDGEPTSPIRVAQHLSMMCESDECTPLCGASMAFYRFSMPFKLTDPGVIPANVGEATLNGVPVTLLEITFDPDVGSDRWLLFVDRENKQIRKIEHYATVEGTAPPEEIFWSDYKTAGGITFSHRRSYYRNNGTLLEEYVITGADFSTPVPESQFVRAPEQPMQTAALVE